MFCGVRCLLCVECCLLNVARSLLIGVVCCVVCCCCVLCLVVVQCVVVRVCVLKVADRCVLRCVCADCCVSFVIVCLLLFVFVVCCMRLVLYAACCLSLCVFPLFVVRRCSLIVVRWWLLIVSLVLRSVSLCVVWCRLATVLVQGVC